MFDEAVKILAENKAANEPAEQRRETREISDLAAQWEQARWAKWAVIIAIGGLGANAAAILLVWLAFRQTRRTADAAVEQAKAANEAVVNAQETAKRQSRAYLSIDPKLVLNWRQPRHLGVSFDLHNHGETVGRHVSYLFDMAISDADLPNGLKFPPPTRSYNPDNSIFPRATTPTRLFFDRALTEKEIATVETDRRVWIWGSLTYQDVFDERRITEFCFGFGGGNFGLNMRGNRDVPWNWEIGHKHNNAT